MCPMAGESLWKPFVSEIDICEAQGNRLQIPARIDCSHSCEQLSPRARQNVVLELGYFVALLGRKNVFVLVAGSGLEQPSDFHGVVYESYDKAGNWRRRLADELSAQGFYIDSTVLKKV